MILRGSRFDLLTATFKKNSFNSNKCRFEGRFFTSSSAIYCSYVIELVKVDVLRECRNILSNAFKVIHISVITKKLDTLDILTPYSLTIDFQFVLNPTNDKDLYQLLTEILQAYRSGSNLNDLISQVKLLLSSSLKK